MATVDQLMSALRKADAAGNTADAKRLAQLIGQNIAPVDRVSHLHFSLVLIIH